LAEADLNAKLARFVGNTHARGPRSEEPSIANDGVVLVMAVLKVEFSRIYKRILSYKGLLTTYNKYTKVFGQNNVHDCNDITIFCQLKRLCTKCIIIHG
jgi:hypothetical protein